MHTNVYYCTGIEPATSYVVGEYFHHYAKSAVLFYIYRYIIRLLISLLVICNL
jgi:hypothetical protein